MAACLWLLWSFPGEDPEQEAVEDLAWGGFQLVRGSDPKSEPRVWPQPCPCHSAHCTNLPLPGLGAEGSSGVSRGKLPSAGQTASSRGEQAAACG